MTTRGLGRRLQRLEAKTGEAVRYVVVWEGVTEDEQAEYIGVAKEGPYKPDTYRY